MKKHRMENLAKGVAVGVAVGAAMGAVGSQMTGHRANKMKKTAGKALRAVGQVVESATAMMK